MCNSAAGGFAPIRLWGVNFIPDKRIPEGEIWALKNGVVDKILNLSTNEISTPDEVIVVEEDRYRSV